MGDGRGSVDYRLLQSKFRPGPGKAFGFLLSCGLSFFLMLPSFSRGAYGMPWSLNLKTEGALENTEPSIFASLIHKMKALRG